MFDVTLSIKKGEIYGYLGPNGAGKSTTMRHLMGFSKPQKGSVYIQGMDCWSEQKKIQRHVEMCIRDRPTALQKMHILSKLFLKMHKNKWQMAT